MSSTTELGILVKLKDEATAEMQKLSGNLQKMAGGTVTAAEASRKFAIGLGIVGTAASGVGLAAIKSASDAEQAQTAFTTMLGSAERAQGFIAKMKDFAAKTPFETSDISKAAQTFLSFGMDVEKVMPNVKMIGDVAMGDKEKFASLSLVFAQVQASGKLMGQDLLQMVGQGFNPLQIMSEKTGKSMSQLKEEMEKGSISADMVTEAFRTATSEGGRFYGGMEAQSQTLAGVWSTLQDTFNEFLRVQGEQMLPLAKEVVAQMSIWIGKIGELTNFLKEHQGVIYAVAGAIGGALVPTMQVLIDTVIPKLLARLALAAISLAPYIVGGAIIGGLIYGIMELIKH
ncbi:MAG: tape measure protein [Candidatus Cloacimonetes bacterium]|nr:tape measure protein [Candidatus Cloacimonadota bacterium]